MDSADLPVELMNQALLSCQYSCLCSGRGLTRQSKIHLEDEDTISQTDVTKETPNNAENDPKYAPLLLSDSTNSLARQSSLPGSESSSTFQESFPVSEQKRVAKRRDVHALTPHPQTVLSRTFVPTISRRPDEHNLICCAAYLLAFELDEDLQSKVAKEVGQAPGVALAGLARSKSKRKTMRATPGSGNAAGSRSRDRINITHRFFANKDSASRKTPTSKTLLSKTGDKAARRSLTLPKPMARPKSPTSSGQAPLLTSPSSANFFPKLNTLFEDDLEEDGVS